MVRFTALADGMTVAVLFASISSKTSVAIASISGTIKFGLTFQ